MKIKGSIIIIIFVLVVVIYNGAYIVDETEQVVITQFGRIIGNPKTSPGLKFKIPFIQKANYFNKNLLDWDGDPGQIPTLDKTFIWVDTFARWKIVDAILFFQTVNNRFAAIGKLNDIIDPSVRNAITLDPNVRALAGEESWTDFVLESRIALRSNDKNDVVGSAGLLFRVTCPAREGAELSGYEITFDRNELALNKQTDTKRQRLATYDLMKLENQPRMNEWNLLRIAADGARIRVWFNRMHPSSDLERGLRIDYTDKNDSVHSGAIGIGTHDVQAWFDDIVVLPLDALPPSRTGDRQ